MNELTIPSSPLWYRNLAVACAPDNTLVYGSKNDIVVVRDKGAAEPVEIKLIHGAHAKYITSVSLNRKWKDPNTYLVSLGEEGILRLWNLETFEKKISNKIHDEHKHAVVGAVFAGDDRVVSASCDGFVMVWNINTNETRQLRDLFNAKVILTCLSSCPHAGWLIAFGLNNGCVVIADLRRNGQVLYRLRGHYQSVVSLSWCPAPVNVFPRHVQNVVKNKTPDTTENDVKQCETEKVKKTNPWINLTHVDDDEVPQASPEPLAQSVNDFLQECDELRAKIMNLEISPKVNGNQPESSEVESCSVSTENNKDIKDTEVEEKGIEEIKESKLNHNRPLPQLFDPSGDFLDDCVDSSATGEIFEDKDIGTEKNQDKYDEQNAKTEIIEEEPRVEYLLASSAKDKSIYIWRAGTDGRMQTFFHTPKRGKSKDAKNTNNYTTLCWITPNILLSSSMIGEILAWTLPKPKESSKQYRIIHHEHSSLIFNIVTTPCCKSPYNWRDEIDKTFWSWGHDGMLINYDINKEKTLFSCYTITSSVTCFDSSSLDPNRLAIGVRDGSIRVWDLSLPHSKIITMHKFYQKVTQKVSTIAWHPIKEMIIGFGTEEGRVGFIDTSLKKSTLFLHYFRNQVHKVEWGPLQGDTTNLGLYAVSEGKIAIYNIQKPNEDPIQLELPEHLYVYKFAWKPDFNVLLISGKDGSLVILKRDLTPLATAYLNEKGFNAMLWHPDAFTNKMEVSPRCNWFAATTSKGLLVYDCVKHIENLSGSENAIIVTFEGHLKPTLSLAWCPFDGNRIVSIAADGLAHVWDVATKSTIATFVETYFCHNPVITWSPVDADLIIIGGEKLIRIWSVSKNPPKTDEEFMTARKRLLNKATNVEGGKMEKKIKVDIPQPKSYPKDCIIPPFYVSSADNTAAQIANMRKIMNNEEDKTDEHKLNPLQLFGEKEDISQLLTANYEEQKRTGKYKCCELVSLWKGNIGEYIKDAINENRVTSSIIALAPMVSLKLWQDASESYARKLSENLESNPLETATYFLACHKIEDAIDCLCKGLMFKEALALAKHRLPESSDVAVKVTEMWAENCIQNGNFETAAYCYISLKQYENAAKTLARRNNKDFLEFAAELAEKADNKELHDSIKFKCNELLTKDKSLNTVVDGAQSSKDDVNNSNESSSKTDTEEECETSSVDNQGINENARNEE